MANPNQVIPSNPVHLKNQLFGWALADFILAIIMVIISSIGITITAHFQLPYLVMVASLVGIGCGFLGFITGMIGVFTKGDPKMTFYVLSYITSVFDLITFLTTAVYLSVLSKLPYAIPVLDWILLITALLHGFCCLRACCTACNVWNAQSGNPASAYGQGCFCFCQCEEKDEGKGKTRIPMQNIKNGNKSGGR